MRETRAPVAAHLARADEFPPQVGVGGEQLRLDLHRPGNMDLPGLRLHPLKGDLAGHWSVTVSGNWRIIFRFEGGHANDVDLSDYH